MPPKKAGNKFSEGTKDHDSNGGKALSFGRV